MVQQQRHDAKFSLPVLKLLEELTNDPARPIPGILFDPFAGVGTGAAIRDDWKGIDIEPKFSAAHPKVSLGNALDPNCYPDGIGCIVTSPTYANRMGGTFVGSRCTACAGSGEVFGKTCDKCAGIGNDSERRKGYAASLGEAPHPESSARFGSFSEGYREFHRKWIRVITDVIDCTGEGIPGLILNMSDHYRTREFSGEPFEEYVHVCRWWLQAANAAGWKFCEAHSVPTRRSKEGANRDSRAPFEQVLLFTL